MPFRDRIDAGRQLADGLTHLREEDVVVLALPRGGVPVAAEVARALHAPLDLIVVRKLGVPWRPELAMGAVGEDGVRVLNDRVLRQAGISDAQLGEVEDRERAELDRRAQMLRRGLPRESLEGRTAVVVDDGIATGATAKAACRVARAHGAQRVVLAVPVASTDAQRALRDDLDEFVCPEAHKLFFGVGQWYEDFAQVEDAEVAAILAAAAKPQDSGRPAWDGEVAIGSAGVTLHGHLHIPDGAGAVVLFAHGSGSGRHSPRNAMVAATLNDAGFGTLLFDLLTDAEEGDRANVFDVDLLAARVMDATHRLRALPQAHGAQVGYFGASTGAAAALVAAAHLGSEISAVVSRGGRPDLAGAALADVSAASLLIVGGRDPDVLRLNEEAQTRLRCDHRLEVVPGATHVFAEPGALGTVARMASAWFLAHLGDGRPYRSPLGHR